MVMLLIPSGLEPLKTRVAYKGGGFTHLVRVEIMKLDLKGLVVKQSCHVAPTDPEDCYHLGYGNPVGADIAAGNECPLDLNLTGLGKPGEHVAIHIVIGDPVVELMSGGEFEGKHVTVGGDRSDRSSTDPHKYLKCIEELDRVRPVGAKARSTVFACMIAEKGADSRIPFNLGVFVYGTVPDAKSPANYVLPVFVDPKVKNDG